MNLQNERRMNVLVTGSSRGIGLAIAKKFSSNCNNVAINSRNNKDLIELCRNDANFFSVSGDVTCEKNAKSIIKNTIKELGSLDTLVCNVGSGKSVSPGNENLDEWKRIFALNFFSATNMIEASKEELAKSKGSIVCISSICGLEVINEAPLTYSIAKSALNSYIKSVSRPLAKQEIRINGIAPGNILLRVLLGMKNLKMIKMQYKIISRKTFL